MRKLLLLLPCLIFCCGFQAAPFEAGAVPKATTARQQAIKACSARTDFKSNDEVIDCTMAADRDFAQAIHLRDASLLADYSGKVKILESDIGTGNVKPADIVTRFRDAQTAFFKAIRDHYADYQSDMAREDSDAMNRATRAMSGMNSMNSMNSMNGMGN